MQTEPWWETNPATTPRQELGMVSPELLSRRTMINPLCVSVSICTSSAYFDAVARRIAKPQFGLSARVIHLDDDRDTGSKDRLPHRKDAGRFWISGRVCQ